MKRFLIFRKGQVVVMYAGIVAALLGATALCTDVAVMYVNSIQLQKAVDSAAIAGATYMAGISFNGPTAAGCTGQPDDAKKAACTYAFNNGIDSSVDGTTLNITETSTPTVTTVTVAAQRTGLPYYFAKAVGLSTYTVAVTSTATASQAVGSTQHMFPVGLQCNNPCSLSNMNPGYPVSFGAKFVNGLAPGNWQWLDLGNGDNGLGTNIDQGATGTFTIGNAITSEPGNNANSQNIRTGLGARLSRCAAIADPCTSGGGNPNNIPTNDPCLIIVPAVDYHACNGSCHVTIEGFAMIYIEPTGPNATTSSKIQGCFVKAVAADSITSVTAPQLGAEMPPSLIN